MVMTIEVALVRAKKGVSTDKLKSAALSIEPVLPDLPGFVERALGVSAEGVWADLIHWRSHEEAEAAVNAVMTIPACMDYFSLVDSELDECALLFEQVSLQSALVPMEAGVLEVVIFKAKEGVSADQLKEAAIAINSLLPNLYGFVSREFGVGANGVYIDLVRWRDAHAAETAARAIAQVPVCAQFFELIDQKHMRFMHFKPIGLAARS